MPRRDKCPTYPVGIFVFYSVCVFVFYLELNEVSMNGWWPSFLRRLRFFFLTA